MSLKSLKFGLILGIAVALAGVSPVTAEEQAGATRRATQTQPKTDAEGYRTARRLGGSRSLYAPCRAGYNARCVGTRKAVQRMGKNKRFQKDLSSVMDQAGLTKYTADVLKIIADADPNVLKETEFQIGDTMEWMGLWNRGKTDIIRKIRWGGTRPPRPFGAWEFTIKDGYQNYNFVIPKPCANLALRNVTEEPLPECATLDTQRSCDTPTKTMSFSASGASISNKQIVRVEVSRAGSKLTDLLPEGNWRFSGPIQPGSYTAKAFDQYGREVQICGGRGTFTIEDCVAPPPPPPPPPTTCNVAVTATKAKGGWNLAVDGSGSGGGASPAAKASVQIFGPDGKPVTFNYEGKSQTQVEIGPPFQATFFVPKAKPGTYTLRGSATAVNPKAEPKTCEATAVIPEYDKVDFFADGMFGKQRRQYEVVASEGSTATVTPGFCDPMLGIRAGALFWTKDERISFAPAAGVAFMFGDLGDFDFSPNEYNSASFFIEGAVNFHFSPRGAFIGTGLDWWDVFDGDHDTGAWLVNFGAPIKATDKGELFFIGEGRLFFDAPDGIDNNYQLWGGLRYIFR